MDTYFLYANYYYNFGFNVTCILNERNEHTDPGPNILKSPSHEWTHFRHTRQSLETLHAYQWEKAKGVGLVLGYNNLRALDIDECADLSIIPDFLNILDLPQDYEWVMRSGSHNGFHILFYAEEHKYEVARNKIKAFKSDRFKHIELRWIGHLVLPPSMHITFNNYAFFNPVIPKRKPLEIDNENLYVLLNKYCKRKPQLPIYTSPIHIQDASSSSEETNKEEELKESRYTSPLHIHDASSSSEETSKKEELEESGYTSPLHIDNASSNSEETSKNGKLEESRYTSPLHIYSSSSSSEEPEAIFSPPYYLFFDTETTGVPNDWNAPVSDLNNWPRLVQLAYLVYDAEGSLVLSKETVIKPDGFLIPKAASDVHGITTDYAMVNGRDLLEVLADFRTQCLQAEFLVAHNINFDSKIMGAEFLRKLSSNPLSDRKQLCTMEASTDYCKILGNFGYKWPKLSELHIKLFGVDFEGAHDALADIEATARCFWELRRLDLI